MLLLTLFACDLTRAWECDARYLALYVQQDGPVDVALDSEKEGLCVRTPAGQAGRFWLIAPVDFAYPFRVDEPDGRPQNLTTQPVMMLTGPEVLHGAEGFDIVQVDWKAAPRAVTTISTFDGLRILSEGSGYAAIHKEGEEVFVRCEDCEVWIPTAPALLRLEITRGTVHACVREGTRISMALETSTAEVWPTGLPILEDINAPDSRVLIRSSASFPHLEEIDAAEVVSGDPSSFCLEVPPPTEPSTAPEDG